VLCFVQLAQIAKDNSVAPETGLVKTSRFLGTK
jgi:hypothetical protein